MRARARHWQLCRRAVDPLQVEVDTILERFIERSFGEASADNDGDGATQPLEQHVPPPPSFKPASEHPSHAGAYSLGDLLGRGRYAQVYIGQRSLSAVPHAVKVFGSVREAQRLAHSRNQPSIEALGGDKAALSLLTVQQQTIYRAAVEAGRTAVAEIDVLRAVAPYACPYLPELVDVVRLKRATANRSAAHQRSGSSANADLVDEDSDAVSIDDDDDDDDDESSDVEDEDVDALERSSNSAPCLAIVLPLYSGGDLAGYVDATRGVPERIARLLMRQLVSATVTLHAAGYLHRDIKVCQRSPLLVALSLVPHQAHRRPTMC